MQQLEQVAFVAAALLAMIPLVLAARPRPQAIPVRARRSDRR